MNQSQEEVKMISDKPEQGVVKIVKSDGHIEPRETIEAPKVNPRVTAEHAVEVLKDWPGGEKVLSKLREEVYKI